MKVDHGVAPVNAGPESRFLHQLRRGAAFLAGYEIWIVIPLVVGGLLTTRLMPVAVGVAGSFWGIRWVGTGRLSIRTPADWATRPTSVPEV